MKRFYEKISDLFAFLKVASMCIGAIYLIFWFWRFFNAPFAEALAPVFDSTLVFITMLFNTTQVYEGHIAEMGYFIMAIVFVFITFVFSILEDSSNELDRRNVVRDIARKRLLQNRVNEQLARENINNISVYRYFSIILKLRVEYINELVANRSTMTPEEGLNRAYLTAVRSIKKDIPHLSAEKRGKNLFVRANGFENFDSVITSVLNSIKVAKAECANDCFKLDFLIVVDAQTNKQDCDNSFNLLTNISNMDDFNKAIVTSAFKVRFDLMKNESKFMTDMLNYSVNINMQDDSELYILKTKPKQI